MNQPNYTATQAYIPFLFLEFKQGCMLYHQGKSIDEIYQLTIEDNTFQTGTEKRRREFSSFVCKRMAVLDPLLINTVATSNSDIARLICFYAIMKTDPLFFEFMYEVYQQHAILNKPHLESTDMKAFIREKGAVNETVEQWSDATVRRLLTGFRNSLVEGGLVTREKQKLKLAHVYLPENIKEHLIKLGDEAYVKAMVGDR